jgi:hypothetical protein|tara:strand:+ start:271 stop:654 length:384 start_codon:yes stop_codon:yes gene_type:complete
VIANKEVLAVNQAYFGDSGGVFETSADVGLTVELTDAFIEASPTEPRVNAAAYQKLYKPVGGGKVAVLLMNSDTATQTLEADFSKVPGLTCTSCPVRDIWNHKDLGTAKGSWSGKVDGHDAAFLVIG